MEIDYVRDNCIVNLWFVNNFNNLKLFWCKQKTKKQNRQLIRKTFILTKVFISFYIYKHTFRMFRPEMWKFFFLSFACCLIDIRNISTLPSTVNEFTSTYVISSILLKNTLKFFPKIQDFLQPWTKLWNENKIPWMGSTHLVRTGRHHSTRGSMRNNFCFFCFLCRFYRNE